MEPAIYIIFAILLLLFAYMIFRRVVRRDYRENGRLSPAGSISQLLVFTGYFTFCYIFIPPEWPWFWRLEGTTAPAIQVIALILMVAGMVLAFGTMAWFGLRRAFGLQVEGIINRGPYKISRNPQILGGYLLVLGVFLQWASLYMAGWVLMYALIGHWMIITEEEHLARVFGEEYESYCAQVPRYL